MGEVPATQYATTSDGTHIAYQIIGDGPPDLVLVPIFSNHVEIVWEHPFFAESLTRLAAFSRLIMFDRRGQGLSDPVVRAPTLEERMDDIRAVMAAASSERAALWVSGDAAPTGLLFCATFPERVSALILVGAHARFTRAPDYPWGPDPAAFQQNIETVEATWGEGRVFGSFFPQLTDAAFAARMERHSLSPGSVRPNLQIVADTDVRHLLGAIRVPTLVLTQRGSRPTTLGHSRYLAANIRDARRLERLPSGVGAHDVDPFEDVADVQEFLTGTRPQPESDRVLATVLFTDIVSSTLRAVDAGDRRWKDIIDRYDDLAEREATRFRGRVVKSTGDGVLAVFDGPGRAVRCAIAMREAVRSLGLAQRAGLHTGEIDLRANDVSGRAVNLAQRVSAVAGADEVLVSRTVVDLLAGSEIDFDDHGEYELKGIPGTWQLLKVRA